MSQVRIYNYGDALTSVKLSTVQAKLFGPGVYEGYDVRVIDAQTLEFYNAADTSSTTVGYLLLPDGVLLSETTLVRLPIATLPSNPTIFTVVAEHVNANIVGGTGAQYRVLTGYFQKGTVANSTVICWIAHPGLSAALAQFMIIQPPKQVVDNFAAAKVQDAFRDFSPPFGDALIVSASGHTVTSVNGDMAPLAGGTDWPQIQCASASTTVGSPSTTVTWTLRALPSPSYVEFVDYIDTGCTIQISVLDTANVATSLSPVGGVVTPTTTPSWQRHVVKVPRYATTTTANGTWTDTRLWKLRLNFVQPASRTCKLAFMRVGFDPTLSV